MSEMYKSADVFFALFYENVLNLPGHLEQMQSWVSNNFPRQARPPPLGAGSVQLRVRNLTPSPHDLLQLLQLDQALKFPSTKTKQNITYLGD